MFDLNAGPIAAPRFLASAVHFYDQWTTGLLFEFDDSRVHFVVVAILRRPFTQNSLPTATFARLFPIIFTWII
jgi:hypothetical protein